MSIKPKGIWKRGLAIDVHTLSNTCLGVNEFGCEHFKTTWSKI